MILLIAVLSVVSACTTARQYSSSEYDDVYYTSEDETVVQAREEQDYRINNSSANNREPYTNESSYERNREIYNDPSLAYADDDFVYSRRLRRFDQPNYQSWRYYDPFFANDLYYVMGTPSWSRWNSLGWHSWNRPRFGTSFSLSFFNSPFGFGPGFRSAWAWNSFNPYDPFINAYYGFDPYFGYGGIDPFWAWNSPFVGFNNVGFCPPFNYAVAGVRPVIVQPRTVRARNTRTALASQTYYTGNRPTATNTLRQSRTSANSVVNGSSVRRPSSGQVSSQYLRPMRESERAATSSRANSNTNVNRRATRSGAPVYTRPSRSSNGRQSSPTNISGRSQSRTNDSYRRPSNYPSRNSNSTRTSRPTRPSNNYSRPSSPRSSSSRSSSPSYSRPSRSSGSSSGSRPSSSRPRRP